jgi:acyl CoA:acetate/3-ketoacid CoA transferase beta subunit
VKAHTAGFVLQNLPVGGSPAPQSSHSHSHVSWLQIELTLGFGPVSVQSSQTYWHEPPGALSQRMPGTGGAPPQSSGHEHVHVVVLHCSPGPQPPQSARQVGSHDVGSQV